MRKTTKIAITLFLILLILGPVFFFLIYPNYNDILTALNSLNFQALSKETTISILTQISPSKENYEERVLGYTSIEESLKNHEITLEEKILEDIDTVLKIERLNIEGRILQGESSLRMDEGFWHFPISPFPGQKGNVVVIGHRFMELPPSKNTFFNLDQTRVGERIVITDDYGEYTYIVTDIIENEPNDMSAIKESNDFRLTLITCTPLWTSEKRLLIIGKLDKLYKKV
ncbi:MAG: sortase [Candidatus Dojkabacteria bacterium]